MLKQILKFKEAIFYAVIILSAFVWLMMQIIPQVMDLIKTEQQIKKRTVEFQTVTEQLDKMKKEAESKLKDKQDIIKKIYKPEISFETQDMEYLLMIDDVVNMIKENNVKVYALDYNYNVQTDDIVTQSSGKYLACQLTLSLIGGYNQIKNLLMDFIKYPYLITLNSVEIEPYKNNKKILLSLIKITIYSEQ